MKFNENSVENIRNIVKEKAQNAIANSVDEEELLKSLYKGKINFGEAITKINKSVVKASTLIEFRILLELFSELDGLHFLKNKKNVDEYIAHENAHANKTEELGAFHDGFEFVLLKEGKKYFLKKIETISVIPQEWDEKRKIETIIAILNAPTEYGGQLSSYDISKIEEIKNKNNL